MRAIATPPAAQASHAGRLADKRAARCQNRPVSAWGPIAYDVISRAERMINEMDRPITRACAS
jgi:hypothetical protein